MRNLDPRTHLFILLLATVMWFFYKEIQAVHFFCLIAFFYMLQAKETRKAFTLLFTYVLLQAAAFAAYRTALLYIILHTAARAVPLMMFSSVIAGCNPSRVLASYAKIRISKTLLIMICIMMRFFSVLMKEMSYIRDGMRARGLFPHWYDYCKHPIVLYEIFFVPLTIRCLKLSDELGASAMLRGLDSSATRSCIYKIGFSKGDGITAVIYTLLMTSLLIISYHNVYYDFF